MRRGFVWAVSVLIALPAAAGIAVAGGGTTQTVSGKATPSKLPENRRIGVALSLKETTGTTDPSGVQPSTTSARILLDKDFLITTRGLDRCRPEQILDKSTAEARQNCRSSLVGTGSAVARISNGAGGHIDIPAVVSAFNAVDNGRRIIVLHVLIGEAAVDIVLQIRRRAGAYGTELATPPGPPQPIHKFTLNLHRTYTVNGERRNYISAKCSHDKLLYKGAFTYTEGPPRTATDSQGCAVR